MMDLMAQSESTYRLMVDELISATVKQRGEGVEGLDYFKGIPISKVHESTGGVSVYNHLDFHVGLHKSMKVGEPSYRIVEFDVEPKSINWGNDPCAIDSEHLDFELMYL